MFGVPLPVGKRGTFGVFCTGSDGPWIGTKKVPSFFMGGKLLATFQKTLHFYTCTTLDINAAPANL